MKKEIGVLIGVIVLILGIIVLVSAWAGEVNFDFDEGWNLVYGLGDINQLDGQVLEKSSIKAIYGFIPTTQEYVQIYPNTDFSKINLIDDDELMNTAFWVYSEKGALSEYWLAEEVVLLKDRPIYKGWNFVGITPDMTIDVNSASPEEEEKYTFSAMKGSCDIQKVYFFDNKHQKWINYPLTEELDKNLIGFGAVVKVSSDCRMGSSGGSSINPPEIPDNGNPVNFIIEKDFGSLRFNTKLGQEYIEREYNSFPLGQMVRGDAAKYGSEVGVNTIVIEFSGDRTSFLNDILGIYEDNNWSSEMLTPPAYPRMYKLNYNPNPNNEIALWISSNYLPIVHGDNIFIDGSDAEQIIEDYHDKYPSSL